jgi:cytochrome c553
MPNVHDVGAEVLRLLSASIAPRRAAKAALMVVLHAAVGSFAAGPDAGEAIYRDGVVSSGAPLVAGRDGGTSMKGAAAACVNCHRRSGLGQVEGTTRTPPITGAYLFRPKAGRATASELPYVNAIRADRGAYTESTLARAIREGVDADGRELSYLMPRFELGDADMAALIGYLKRLDPRRSPGVLATDLHLATVITPDADPLQRKGMMAVLEQFFAERNVRQRAPSPQLVTSARNNFAQMNFRPSRHWHLHVWELSGPASTWSAQLDRYLAAQPVFAVVSGLGGAQWVPVHEFCERATLPCLFPNVPVTPERAEKDHYSLYFTRGVNLEADLLAARLLNTSPTRPPKSALQVYRIASAGEAAAVSLARQLRAKGILVRQRVLPAIPEPGGGGLSFDDPEAASVDAIVLWLSPDDLAKLQALPPVSTAVYASGLLGGLERAPVPSTWRSRVQLTYPVDLPERRRVRVDFALGWFRAEHIELVAPQVQVDTYLACSLLSETLNHMSDTMVRDYLMERLEDTIEHRIMTGYYPRLALGPGQRYASKGGYLVHLAGGGRPQGVVADSGWIVP